MNYHPYSEIWPLMEGEDFEKLKADIKANGQRLSITTYKDMILDGRNRERACEALGLIPWRIDAGDISEAQALDLVVSLNDQRRHMSKVQRAFAADKLANILHSGRPKVIAPQGAIKTDRSENVSMEKAAVMLNVSRRHVQRARVVRLHGTARAKQA
jgi:ParB-like chromosome segregation protein Spo0J